MADDEWGTDQAVRMMRVVFRSMEEAQNSMLGALGIAPFDPRLRRWREIALGLWKRFWGRTARSGAPDPEEKAAGLYLACLSRVLARDGVEVPAGLLPRDEEIERVMREVLP